MSEPFLGAMTIVPFDFAPRGYAFCNGQLMSINQNQALFALLGTTYGGDGRITFGLPDLRGSSPVHPGQDVIQGEKGGEVSHTLTVPEMPQHTHTAQAATTGTAAGPSGAVWAGLASGTAMQYATGTPNVSMEAAVVSPMGGSQPHNNIQPYLVLNFVIALTGIFPSRN